MTKTYFHTIQVGDVFVESWGYDQTNIDFYQVVRVMPKSVEIQAIHATPVGEGYDTKLVPDLDNFRAGGRTPKSAKRKLVQFYDVNRNKIPPPVVQLEPYLTMSSYSNAHLWNGERAYFDTIAAGFPGH